MSRPKGRHGRRKTESDSRSETVYRAQVIICLVNTIESKIAREIGEV
jgi:hypothetical protein